MKTKLKILAILLVMTTAGCNDYAVKTKINPDGSFERTIICTGDSLGLYALALPYVFSDSWSIDIQRKKDGEKNFVTTAKKSYANSEQLMAEFSKGKDTSKLQISSRIEKRFRWFFSYFTYTETLPPYARFRHLSVDSFFTPVEIGLMKEGKDSLIHKRTEEFWNRNIVEEFLQRLTVKLRLLNDPSLPPALIDAHRNELTQKLVENEKAKPDEIAEIMKGTLNVPSFKKLREIIDSLFKDLLNDLEKEGNLEITFKNEVAMPGILLSSNSIKIEGNIVRWDCKSKRYFDIVMTAESRIVNLWAIILTSVLCVVILVLLLLPIIHAKKWNFLN
jgi:hypothetical protein